MAHRWVDQWDAAGYIGRVPYFVKVAATPAGGITCEYPYEEWSW